MAELQDIIPGTNYPTYVEVAEDNNTVRFNLKSYVSGMYCSISLVKGMDPIQTGDRDNKKFVTTLISDLKNAQKRGAVVTIGDLAPIKTL